MSAAGRAAPLSAPITLKIELPRRFGFLLELHPYKVAYGGRFGLKSWSFADAILALGANQQLRIVCGRQVMKSLADSVHKLLCDRIVALGLTGFYSILENKIRGSNGTEISYAGLSDQTAQSVKSFEAVDIFWVEEAQTVEDDAWALLLPTIRKPNSEVWVSFNPDMESHATWQRFVVNPPEGAIVVKSTFEYAKACGFFTEKMEQLRLYDQKHYPDDYANIWLGMPRVTVAGAIYAREVIQLTEEKRFRPAPYDPMLPVDRIWDLGWNDAMSIIMVQKPSPNALNIINYREDSFRRYDEYIGEFEQLRYRVGKDWLPHDGENGDPKSGKSAKQILQALGCRVEIMPRTGPEQRIKAGRMLFPRIYVDNTERKVTTGYLGCARLMDCLKRYRRNVPKSTGEPATPVHDEYSHGSDAFGALGEIVDRISAEFVKPFTPLPQFHNPDPSMGLLG